MTVVIPLTRGQQAVISDEDADLAEFKWRADFHCTYANGGKYHAVRGIRPKGCRYQTIILHRVILSRMLGRELTRHELVDHIDNDPLNNTRENLRLATNAQNQANRGKTCRNTSGYKGVFFNKSSRKYVAQICLNNKRCHLGAFLTPEEAHAAYCKAARELYGEFARFE